MNQLKCPSCGAALSISSPYEIVVECPIAILKLLMKVPINQKIILLSLRFFLFVGQKIR